MASLRRKGRYYFACFTLPDGRQTQRSTRQTDRKAAQKIADSYEQVTKQKMTERQIRSVMTDLFEQTTGRRLASAHVGDYIDQFLKNKERTASVATFAKYRQVLGKFRGQLGDRADMDLNFVTGTDIEQFRDSFDGLSAGTANACLRLLKAFLQSAWKSGIVAENVGRKVESVKAETGVGRRAFTIAELQRILEAAGDSEWRGLILFGLYTGARLGDIAALTWQNVHGVEVRFQTRKTGRQQILPLADPLIRYLENIPSSDGAAAPLFPRAFDVLARQERVGTLSNGFRDILENAGMMAPRNRKSTGQGHAVRRKTNRLSFHSLRHTATSLLKAAGIGASTVMDIIGHDSEAASAHYTHTADDAKRAALNKLPDLTKDF